MGKGQQKIEIVINGEKRCAVVSESAYKHFVKDVNTVLDALGFARQNRQPVEIPSLMKAVTRRMVASSYPKDAPYSALARLMRCTKSSVRHFAIKNLDSLEESVGLMFTHEWCAETGQFPISACLAEFIVDGVASDYIEGDTIKEISDTYNLPESIVSSIIDELDLPGSANDQETTGP